MAIDKDKKGVPLAFLFFPAPTGNQLSSSKFRGGKSFYVLVAMTDTDLKERAALIRVFPGVVLSVVTGKSAESVEVKARLRLVEEKLGEACILDDTGVFHRHYRGRDAGFDIMDGNVAWSTGRERTPSIFPAAGILGCEFDGVLPATNHLESFNGLLKRKYFRRWQRGGRDLRVDVLTRGI
ncbi:hypothetical protein B0H13DRAFT_2319738 [Mycena leptocephala]|nr:hypothetical protein B0H13DRAFT_2319738 [Mycena leptocephala]